jgi:hypothetical protein
LDDFSMNILTSDLMDRIGAGLTRARLRSVQEQVWAAKPLDVRFQLIKKNRDWRDKRLPACSEDLVVQALADSGVANSVVQLSAVGKDVIQMKKILEEAEKTHTGPLMRSTSAACSSRRT